MAKQIKKVKDSLSENQCCLQHTACCRKLNTVDHIIIIKYYRGLKEK